MLATDRRSRYKLLRGEIFLTVKRFFFFVMPGFAKRAILDVPTARRRKSR
jgi:hypothetical protein